MAFGQCMNLMCSACGNYLTLFLPCHQEELNVPYEIKEYQRTSTRQAPDSLKEVHPLGKSPIITDGDLTLAESGAIIGLYQLLLF